MLDHAVTAARPLEKLYAKTGTPTRGPSSFELLRDLRIDGRPLLTYQRPAAEHGGGFWDKVGRTLSGPPLGTWHAAGSGISFPGTVDTCPALDTWGPSTRAVIGPALAYLHQVEDTHRARLGSKPRKNRVHVTDDQHHPAAVQAAPHRTVPAPRRAQLPASRPTVQDYLPGNGY